MVGTVSRIDPLAIRRQHVEYMLNRCIARLERLHAVAHGDAVCELVRERRLPASSEGRFEDRNDLEKDELRPGHRRLIKERHKIWKT
jgi:hypothetical protein